MRKVVEMKKQNAEKICQFAQMQNAIICSSYTCRSYSSPRGISYRKNVQKNTPRFVSVKNDSMQSIMHILFALKF